MSETGIKCSWLQLSDLHVFNTADKNLIIQSYEELSKSISPDFIVVTGDFRHLKDESTFDYKNAKDFLSRICKIFRINDKNNVFLVPGNHDVNIHSDKNVKNARYVAVDKTIKNGYNSYKENLNDLITCGFSEYTQFVKDFYADSGIEDERVKNPAGVYCSVWQNIINIVHVNTALISDNNKEHKQIVDFEAIIELADRLDRSRPTIMLAHHGIEALDNSHQVYLKKALENSEYSAYLHGDIHRYKIDNAIRPAYTKDSINAPQIACAKSAPPDRVPFHNPDHASVFR